MVLVSIFLVLISRITAIGLATERDIPESQMATAVAPNGSYIT